MQEQSEPQMAEAAILVSVPHTAEAHHKDPAARARGQPQTGGSARRSTPGEELPQAARQTAVAELLNTELIELVLQKSPRKEQAATPQQVGLRTDEPGMARADLQTALVAPAPAARTTDH